MYLDTKDCMLTPSILCWGSWEPETAQSLDDILRPGMNWVDVGANVGVFTIIGHRIVRDGGGATWAFEANPSTYGLLVDNINLNWFFSNVTAEQKAVYSENTRVRFHAPRKFNVNATIGSVRDGNWDAVGDIDDVIDVDAVALDSYFNPGQRLDAMKIDVEGAELFALRGARRILQENHSIKILLEWSPIQGVVCGYQPAELAEEIRSLGFTCKLAEQDRRSISFESLLKIHDTTMLLLERP